MTNYYYYYFNPRKNEGGKKNTKSTKRFEVEKLVRVVLRGKTVVQQHGVKTLIGNRNALKYYYFYCYKSVVISIKLYVPYNYNICVTSKLQ